MILRINQGVVTNLVIRFLNSKINTESNGFCDLYYCILAQALCHAPNRMRQKFRRSFKTATITRLLAMPDSSSIFASESSLNINPNYSLLWKSFPLHPIRDSIFRIKQQFVSKLFIGRQPLFKHGNSDTGARIYIVIHYNFFFSGSVLPVESSHILGQSSFKGNGHGNYHCVQTRQIESFPDQRTGRKKAEGSMRR